MPTLCETFKLLANQTWDYIKQSRDANFQLKEETLTDINMLKLKLEHSREVTTKVFNKHKEGVNGSDWEWWFRGQNRMWIGFRIQAKIINNDSNRFEHLHYKGDDGVYQCDKLIAKSLTEQSPRIPLYCLFIQTNNQHYLTTWQCGTNQYSRSLFGCSLISAFKVKEFQLDPNIWDHINDIENEIRPWHCLVCCTGYGGTDFISNIEAYAYNNFNLDDDGTNDIIGGLSYSFPGKFSTDTPPSYVLDILEYPKNDNLKSPDEDLEGVIIITEPVGE